MKKLSPIYGLVLVLVVVALGMATMTFAEMGTVEGTGADLTVTLGYAPSHVKVTNIDGKGESLEWFKGMADDSAVKLTNAVDGTSLTVTLSNGITPVAAVYNATTGQVINSPGFAIGADAKVNVSAETIFYQVDR